MKLTFDITPMVKKDNFVSNPSVVVDHQLIGLLKKINDFDAESTWGLLLLQNTENIKETDASYLCFVSLLASETTVLICPLLLLSLILHLGNSLVLKHQLLHCCLPCYPRRHFFQSYPFSRKFRLLMLK